MSQSNSPMSYTRTYGTNHAMAEIAAEAARAGRRRGARPARCRNRPRRVVAEPRSTGPRQAEKSADIRRGDDRRHGMGPTPYLFSGHATRFGTVASQMRAFIRHAGGQWSAGALANKAVSAMTSTQNLHGGMETER